MSIGRENIIWGREKCKNCREKKYNGHHNIAAGLSDKIITF